MAFTPVPYQQFIWVSPDLEAKAKRSCLIGTVMSFASFPVLGIATVFLAGGVVELMWVKLFEGCCAGWIFFGGFYMMQGRSFVKSGFLNWTFAWALRRRLKALSIIQAVFLGFAYLAVIVNFAAETDVAFGSKVVAAVLPIFLLGIPVMNFYLVQHLLPPNRTTLNRYGLTGQLVAPPDMPAQPRW